ACCNPVYHSGIQDMSIIHPFIFFFSVTETSEIYSFPYTTLFRSQLQICKVRATNKQEKTNPSHQGEERLIDVTFALMAGVGFLRSEEHTSELQSQSNLVCRLLLEQKSTVTFRPCMIINRCFIRSV